MGTAEAARRTAEGEGATRGAEKKGQTRSQRGRIHRGQTTTSGKIPSPFQF